MTIDLPPRDRRIHVFAVSDGGEAIPHQTYLGGTASDGAALRAALGAQIDPTHAEVFAISDILPMTLRDYLSQAHDIPPANLVADAAKLDALSGDVVVLAPAALEGVSVLQPAAHLTHMGAYDPVEADDTPRPLPRAVKEPETAAPDTTKGGGALGRPTIAAIVAAALVVAVIVFVLL
ncbi:hypothetical protein [Jannaschia aquimarina]|uniref:Uncharacterized protein n=1 Tax=Jannaschia aquimarina TaxID=935700 RepID=A0A0D1DAY5_9RHOB|nr:hypothetical protein [Jannaschia aquimarina]KIT17103.1 hypothetical protein jaqu_11450 [Jannaschia aquimarina]SNS46879.1 hypothetical protein SAMN05421775_10166 [Jannaschia aquimarina]